MEGDKPKSHIAPDRFLTVARRFFRRDWLEWVCSLDLIPVIPQRHILLAVYLKSCNRRFHSSAPVCSVLNSIWRYRRGRNQCSTLWYPDKAGFNSSGWAARQSCETTSKIIHTTHFLNVQRGVLNKLRRASIGVVVYNPRGLEGWLPRIKEYF